MTHDKIIATLKWAQKTLHFVLKVDKPYGNLVDLDALIADLEANPPLTVTVGQPFTFPNHAVVPAQISMAMIADAKISTAMDAAWVALRSPGLTREGCDYLATGFCNKCGHDHRAAPEKDLVWAVANVSAGVTRGIEREPVIGVEAAEKVIAMVRAASPAPARLTDQQVLDLRSKHGWAKETIRAIEAAILAL